METTTPEADAPMTATTTSSSEDSKLLESRRLRISINNNNNSVSNNSNANNTTNHSNHYQNDHQMPPVPPPIGAIGRSRLTEETSSDIHSAFSSDGAYEVIEYDFPYENNGGGRKDRDILDEDDDVDAVLNVNYFSDISSLSIQEDSPAAAALRANASVHVSSMGKVARAVHMQTVRRVLKRAAGKSTFGNIRGKPPRVPPKKVSASLTSYPEKDEFDEDSDEDEDDDDDDEVDDGEIDHDNKNKNSKREDDAEKDEIVWSEPMSLPSKQIEQLREAVNKCNIATGGHPWLEDLTEQNHSESCGGVGAMAKTETEKQQQHLRRMQLDKETMHIPDGVAPGTVEAGKKVLRSVDPHDLLKLVRWNRKRKGESSKNNKSYVKGKVIDGEHELYTLSIAVMIGVRTSISRTNTVLNSLLPSKRWVHSSDFKTTQKYEFHPKGDGPLPPHQLAHTFKFKDYCPLVFAYLRRMYGVNEFDFLLSVCGNANFIEFISNAKSGQFFFYSGDGRYMIKTMTNAESRLLRRIMPDYFKHCCENPNTMITRFLGMYRVKLYHLRRNVKFVIMNSVYYTDKHLQTFYDLKGSSVGREAKPGQAVLKDNDLRQILPEQALTLKPQQRQAVRAQIEADCEFLRAMGVMDFSMLVGIHYVPPFEGRTSMTFKKNKGGRPRKNTASSFNNDDSDVHDVGDVFLSFRKMNRAKHRKNTDSSFNNEDSEATDSDLKFVSDGIVQDSSVSSSLADFMTTKSHRRSMSAGHNRTRSDTLSSAIIHSFEDGEEDENSYLVGSNNRTPIERVVDETIELKKQVTIEKLFWPFHNFFDIHGYRRQLPVECDVCHSSPCDCLDSDSKLLHEYNIPKFLPPLSDRKDGGFEMDTTGLHLPMKGKGPTGEIMFEGKIFYMGVIDVLQEYGSRKELESFYRMMRAPDRMAASCVPPKDYARRFLDFFDEYTRRATGGNKDEEGVEVSVRLE